jgi:Transposase DDE domain
VAVQQEEIMSQGTVYQQIEEFLARDLSQHVQYWTRKRLTLLVTGIIQGRSSAPSQMAQAIDALGVEEASVESIERRIRRSENDRVINARCSYGPLVRAVLERSQLQELILIIDPTAEENHLVMVSVNAWYRGRSLPLAWTVWPGNVPLKGEGFWMRIERLLEEVQSLLPEGVPVTILGDRAFGTPAFTDRVEALGWNWVVRLHDRTVFQDRCARDHAVGSLVQQPGQRRKLAGKMFRVAGWRTGSVVVYWGRRYRKALCLGSNLPPSWELMALYRRRFLIETSFRDLKSYGWHWEQGQVRNLEHVERLLVAMALATCITLLLGTVFAQQLLTTPPTGRRHTLPWHGKRSLFQLGLQRWRDWWKGKHCQIPDMLSDWHAPNWSAQIRAHHARAFIFA